MAIHKIGFFKLLFFVLGVLQLTSCTTSIQKKEQKGLNVLWINADDLGRELSCYGNLDIKTPNIDKLAQQGALYTNAYANAPICSVSRSSMITGMYPTTINSQDHRTLNKTKLPTGILPVTALFKKANYFCVNGNASAAAKRGKEDFNFLSDYLFDGVDWNQRKEGQPFFAQIQIHYPHRPYFKKDKEHPVDASKVTLPKCYPDHPLLKADWALYLESVQKCDLLVGKILDKLEKDGLADNTVVFFFGDHGRPHLRDKQFLYEGGIQIPLIVRYPKHLKPNTRKEELVSLIDVTATSLDIANIEVPKYMHGKVFLGEKATERKYIFGFRQRAGDAVEDMRSISDGKHKLIWNKTYDRPWMQLSSYKKLQYPAFTLYKVLHKKGALKHPYNQFMANTKPEIELYNLEEDPSEFNNLATTIEYQEIKQTLFNTLKTNLKDFEKNMILEDEATIAKAKESSKAYYIKALGRQKPQLQPNASDEEILKDWETRLLIN